MSRAADLKANAKEAMAVARFDAVYEALKRELRNTHPDMAPWLLAGDREDFGKALPTHCRITRAILYALDQLEAD